MRRTLTSSHNPDRARGAANLRCRRARRRRVPRRAAAALAKALHQASSEGRAQPTPGRKTICRIIDADARRWPARVFTVSSSRPNGRPPASASRHWPRAVSKATALAWLAAALRAVFSRVLTRSVRASTVAASALLPSSAPRRLLCSSSRAALPMAASSAATRAPSAAISRPPISTRGSLERR